ncbi:hypothetical protein AVEN_67376-1 [Araneus ventricosus]|uniref:Uncharacterized protein n=1 Tax=Araneus ventricosus TaxID=182803 RepID=A0A4Y2PT21_ARAVE|nr:hypothetical protein AVEN_64057-1 [Araneus ventricosus]GBN53712.1 hypothetical protein AVEN_67376-1 [Araneus ventricosus]
MIWLAAGPIHGGSLVESGFQPRALRPRSRDLTTRPPLPSQNRTFQDDNALEQAVNHLIVITGGGIVHLNGDAKYGASL